MTTDDILKIISALGVDCRYTDRELAVLYLIGIHTNIWGINWATVNDAIIKAHSPSYLTRVKTRAWELYQRLMDDDNGSPTL